MKDNLDECGFRFQIGDIVAVRGSATTTASGVLTWASDRDHRYIVQERLAQECPGGVQLHYSTRAFSRDGAAAKESIRFMEIELEPSEPFRVLSEEEEDARRSARQKKD